MAAKFLTGFSAVFTAALTTTATTLPINMADREALCAALGGDHSYLVITNSSGAVEIVRVSCSGSVITIVRGDAPIAAAIGACVRFEVTSDLLDEYTPASSAICSVTAGTGLVATTYGCAVTIDHADCVPTDWKVGNLRYTFADGCVTTAAATTCLLTAGTYRNATITVNANGEICAVAEGANIVYSQNPCCLGCNN